MTKIRFRVSVCPMDENDNVNPAEISYCEAWCTEADIQAINEKYTFDDFVERFLKPPIYLLVDRFEQPYTDAEDAVDKIAATGVGHLSRSIDFYRQKIAIDKALRAAARVSA